MIIDSLFPLTKIEHLIIYSKKNTLHLEPPIGD